MIAVNVAVFVLEMLQPGAAEFLALQTGNGLHPYQWLTNNFVHADFMHILSNMLFLWSFGLVVEGKLGWLRTLAVYLGNFSKGTSRRPWAFTAALPRNNPLGYCRRANYAG